MNLDDFLHSGTAKARTCRAGVNLEKTEAFSNSPPSSSWDISLN